MPRLTPLQLETLGRLNERRWKHPIQQVTGFNAISFGGARNAACARSMVKRGWVRTSHISAQHIRYAITPNGVAALEAEERRRGSEATVTAGDAV